MPLPIGFHYTSTEALFEIVRSGRFRLSNIFFMNDYMEVDWCCNLALKMMENRKEDEFDRLFELVQQRGFDYIFCGCFSTLHDDLSQWRGYADDGRGVAIGVTLSQLVASDESGILESMRMVYDEAKQDGAISKLLSDFLVDVS